MKIYLELVSKNKSKEVENEDTRLLYSLADFFKMQDSAKYYDFAERLFKRWKETSEVEAKTPNKEFNGGKKKSAQLRANSMVKFEHDNIPHEKSPTHKKGEGRNRIFNKLYETAAIIREKVITKQVLQNEVAMKKCTFKPKIYTVNSIYHNKNLGNSHERLTNRNNNKEYLEKKKALLELEHCTFSPALPNLRDHWVQTPPKDNIYKRSFNQKKMLEETIKYKQSVIRAKELDECTFSPSINKHKGNLRIVETVHDRLYNDYEKKRHNAEKKQLEHIETQLAPCTFHPNLSSSLKNHTKSIQEIPRYEKLYLKDAERTYNLEQKRLELDKEAKETHQTIERMNEPLLASPEEVTNELYNEYKVNKRKRQELEAKYFKVFF